jgi:DNA-binding GntR family transcriptional regulator
VQLSREDIVDLYELREALEVYAVGKVARAPLRAADLGRLQKLVDDILVLKKELETSGAPALDAQQMNRFVACDLGFHALLMSMAVNARMQKIVNETRLLIRIFAIRRRGHDPAMLERIHRQHQEILDAVAKQQVEAAMRVLSAHIQTSKQERLEEFDYWKREASIRQSLPALFDVHNLASW